LVVAAHAAWHASLLKLGTALPDLVADPANRNGDTAAKAEPLSCQKTWKFEDAGRPSAMEQFMPVWFGHGQHCYKRFGKR